MTAKEMPMATILLVDDEENILRSLKRVLRSEPCNVITATSGQQALHLMDGARVDLVVSDARMPGMDGPTLLAEIKRRHPNCIRILLTGYADITTTVKAINEGQIFRYISKPWNDDELKITLKQALAFQYSERRRLALERLTRKQNQELKALNESLEEKVRARTAELKETADMLDLAYKDLRQSYVVATEVFASLINKRLPASRQPNTKIISLLKSFAEDQKFDEEFQRDLVMSAALYNLGKLTWRDDLFSAPSELLLKAQRETYRKYPAAGEQLLMPLESLRNAAKMIRSHQENWNGRGFPDRLSADAIPKGARVLRLAVDFVELQFGLVLEKEQSRQQALDYLKRYRAKFYDPELADAFVDFVIRVAPDIEQFDPEMRVLDTRRVEPGMVLAKNLYSGTGMLLLKAGRALTNNLIEKLIAFESGESEDRRYSLYVYPPANGEKE